MILQWRGQNQIFGVGELILKLIVPMEEQRILGIEMGLGQKET